LFAATTVDVNLLAALDALLQEGSGTGAARRARATTPPTGRARVPIDRALRRLGLARHVAVTVADDLAALRAVAPGARAAPPGPAAVAPTSGR
jgi:hypothetical protein